MDIVLLTIGYPYPGKDVFVGNELSMLAEQFDNVWLVPVCEGKWLPRKKADGPLPQLPANVHICTVDYGIRDIIGIRPRLLKAIFAEWRFDLRHIAKTVRWALHANVVLRRLTRATKRGDWEPGNTILYSFWFHFNALAISLVDEPFALKIARAHRYDLYPDFGSQPYKRLIMNELHAVYACSLTGRDYLQEQYGGSKPDVAYLGSVNRCASSAGVPQRNRRFTIVSCSRIIGLKRIHRIADALAEIREPLTWVHIGDGELLREVQSYAEQKLKDCGNIECRFVGGLSNERVKEYYRDRPVHLFVNVSETEGLPVSIMEAASFGIPVVATDVGGVHEIVEHGSNGRLLAKDFASGELADAIRSFMTMPDGEYEAYCRASREKWETSFDADKNYRDFAARLTEMANRRGIGYHSHA